MENDNVASQGRKSIIVPRWSETETCAFCCQEYNYETQHRCNECDEPICPMCVTAGTGTRVVCPHCFGGCSEMPEADQP